MELGPVVGGDGVSGASGVVDHADRTTVRGLDGSGLELTDQQVAGLTIDEREDAVLVRDATDHGVGFEVTDTASVLCSSWTLRYRPLAGEPTAGIVVPVSFSALFGRTAQMSM